MRFPRLVLATAGTVFVAIGVAFLLDPVAMARMVSLRLTEPGASVSVRATDGGLQLGLGIFFLVANIRERWIRAGVGAVILACGGLAFGRAAGMIMAGRFEQVHVIFFVLDLLAVVVGLAAFSRAKAVYDASRNERRRTE